MRILSLFLRRFTPKVEQAAENIAAKKGSLTKVTLDSVQGIIRTERPIMRNGQKATAISETRTLEDGSRQIYTRIEGGGNELRRIKTIKREEGASVFDGNKITITKDDTHSLGDTSIMTKEYSSRGLEHVDYKEICKNGDYTKFHITQDRVFDDIRPDISPKRLSTINLDDVKGYRMDIYDERCHISYSNRDKFIANKSNYEIALENKEKAAAEAAVKAAEEKAATEAAAKITGKKASADAAVKLPWVNTNKLLNIDPSKLKMKEVQKPDGSVTRYFFTEDFKAPLIKTFDHNGIHKEWIYRGKNFDSMYAYMTDYRTYIEMKQGNVHNMFRRKPQFERKTPYSESTRVEDLTTKIQTYNNGLIHIYKDKEEGYKGIIKLSMPDGNTLKAKITGDKTPELNSESYEKIWDIFKNQNLNSFEMFISDIKKSLYEVVKEMESKKVNLSEFFAPFSP